MYDICFAGARDHHKHTLLVPRHQPATHLRDGFLRRVLAASGTGTLVIIGKMLSSEKCEGEWLDARKM